jgi:hypothetical protein
VSGTVNSFSTSTASTRASMAFRIGSGMVRKVANAGKRKGPATS